MATIATNICKYARFRASDRPAEHIPLGARSVGHHTVLPGWRDDVFRVEHVVFLWAIKGTGVIQVDGRPFELGPNSIGVYMPGQVQAMSAMEEEWEYCWWTMDGPKASEITTSFGFATGVYAAGPAPRALLRQLDGVIQRPGRDSEIEAAAIAYELLSAAAKYSLPRKARQHDERLIDAAVNGILSSWQDPGFGVETLAASLGTHRSTLSRKFHRIAGTTVIEYINAIRLHNATNMLKYTDQSIGQIAFQSGYADPNYFSKVFKTRLGIPPSDFRKTSRS